MLLFSHQLIAKNPVIIYGGTKKRVLDVLVVDRRISSQTNQSRQSETSVAHHQKSVNSWAGDVLLLYRYILRNSRYVPENASINYSSSNIYLVPCIILLLFSHQLIAKNPVRGHRTNSNNNWLEGSASSDCVGQAVEPSNQQKTCFRVQ